MKVGSLSCFCEHEYYYYTLAGVHCGTVEGTSQKVAGSNPECFTGIVH